jgi:hypothetical protein
MGNSKA